MKKIIFLLLVAAVCVSVVYAGVKDIQKSVGTTTVTLSDSATTTSNTGYFDKVQITNPFNEKKFDHLKGVLFFSDMVASDTAIGNTDTVVVSWKFGLGPYTVTAEVDTGLPPCTLTFDYHEYVSNAYTILGDSTAVLTTETFNDYLMYDQFWFEYNIADTALAVDSSGTTTMQYWITYIEE